MNFKNTTAATTPSGSTQIHAETNGATFIHDHLFPYTVAGQTKIVKTIFKMEAANLTISHLRTSPHWNELPSDNTEKPLFHHDSEEECIFLGSHANRDLWYCEQDGCLIHRHGSDPAEYGALSKDIVVQFPHPYLTEALNRLNSLQ